MRSVVVGVVGLAACVVAAVVAPPTDILGYGIFGIQRVTIGANVRVEGDAGVLFESLEIGRRARVAGAAAAPSIVVKRRASATTFFCGTVTSAAATCEPLPSPLIGGPEIVLALPGNLDVSAPPRSQANTALTAGGYGRLAIGAAARVTLAGGRYHFESIDLAKRGQLACLAACEVVVRSRATIGVAARFGADAGVSPEDVILRIAAQGETVAFDAGPRATLLGSVYAPSGDVTIGTAAKVTGAVVGNVVTIGRRARLRRTAGGT